MGDPEPAAAELSLDPDKWIEKIKDLEGKLADLRKQITSLSAQVADSVPIAHLESAVGTLKDELAGLTRALGSVGNARIDPAL